MSNSIKKSDLVILSVDPGYDRLGVAIIKEDRGANGAPNGKLTLLFSDCIVTDKKNSHEDRLAIVGNGISKLIKEWRPQELAIEELFFSKNQTTALLVSQALGVVIYEAARAGVMVFYYKPIEVKVAVTGYGKSDKTAVTDMVPRLIKIEPKAGSAKRLDDEYDAIAVGLTHLACRRQSLKSKP